MIFFNYYQYNKLRKRENRHSFCLAPFNSMFFSFNGYVYPCHNNATLAYGKIGEKSLKDIWEDKNRQLYQKQLTKNNLAKVGCLQCLMDIKLNNYNSVNALRYDNYNYPPEKYYPSVMGFRLSDKCNIHCIMCYSNQKIRTHKPIASPYNSVFFEELSEFIPHLKFAYFTGGEPFFEEKNYEVFELFAKLNPECSLTVQTNGTILNDKVRLILEKCSFNINVSIDSLRKENFELIRKGANYDMVMQNIQEFRAYCKKNGTNFNSCITPLKYNAEEIPVLIDYYNKNNDTIWINKYYFPAEHSIWALKSSSIYKIIQSISLVRFEHKSSTSEYNLKQFADFLSILKHDYREAIKRETQIMNFSKKNTHLLKKIRLMIEKQQFISQEDYSKINILLNGIQDVNPQKLYYYLKQLLSSFSGDKLIEILTMFDSRTLIRDIKKVETDRK